MNPEMQIKIRWAALILVVAVAVFGRLANAQTHWSDGPAELAVCDALVVTDGYDAATFCVARYQAAAAGTWTDAGGQEFAHAVPLVTVLLVAGLGFSIGSAVFPR